MKNIINIKISGPVGCGKSSISSLLKSRLNDIGNYNVHFIGKDTNEHEPYNKERAINNLSDSKVFQDLVVLIEEENSPLTGIKPEETILELIKKINCSYNYQRIIIFNSKETDPKLAFQESKINIRDLQSASLVVQKTAYEGHYYLHKCRTCQPNILVDRDTLFDILLKNA